MSESYDVVIIGGSYAGLSAAMSLGRSLRKVLVVDAGDPCNAQTPHSHNFLTQDGKTPKEIAQVARQQISAYNTVELLSDTVSKVDKRHQGFEITMLSGKITAAKKLIFATGIKDQLAAIPGLSACWGISVVHCPYCHGYEHKAKKTAILANGETAMHYAILVGNLTADLQILTNGPKDFSDEQMSKLKSHNIDIIETQVSEILHKSGSVHTVVLSTGERLPFDAVYYRPPFVQHCSIPEQLGAEINEQGYLKVDAMQKTTVENVFACGDNSNMMRSVAGAVAAGNVAGAVVNRELSTSLF